MKLRDVSLKEWIKALRSGEYEQTRYTLSGVEKNSYCCLGVYGHLCGITKNEMGSIGLLNDFNSTFGTDIQLPTKYEEGDLATWNDGEDGFVKHTFDEIADILEGNMKPKKKRIS